MKAMKAFRGHQKYIVTAEPGEVIIVISKNEIPMWCAVCTEAALRVDDDEADKLYDLIEYLNKPEEVLQ